MPIWHARWLSLRRVLVGGPDENDPACGRGWAVFDTAGRLVGHFYIQNANDSGFVCERA